MQEETMQTLTTFPSEYKNINAYVASITFPHDIEKDMGNADVLVNLKDGDSYSFTAFTPDNVKYLMEREGLKSFVSPGLVVVREIQVEFILDCIDRYLDLVSGGALSKGSVGILQR
jgi:hypothetical protein